MKFCFTTCLVFVTLLALALGVPGNCKGDLVAHWTGDNAAVDETGNGHDGTINGATFATGIIGNAFSFDGINDSIIVTADTDLEPANISVSLWVQSGLENHIRNLVDSTHGAGNAGWAVQLTAANTASFAYGNGAVSFPEITAAVGIGDGQFHHVAATLDGTDMRLYIDGTIAATGAYGASPQLPSGRDIQLGRHLSLNRPLQGQLDDVRIYNHVLSDADVTALFNAASVPEPAGASLIVVAALAFGARRRRQ